MVIILQPPLTPRKGEKLWVLGVARISTVKQDELSLEDQEALIRRWLAARWSGQYELVMVSGRGSGERLDREELERVHQELLTERYDLVLAEDLGRIMRRMEAYRFCETAEDVRTRVVTINDHLDTANPNWRVMATFASLHHELHNADTSNRIRRTLRNRFENGSNLRPPIFGYIKPPGATSEEELQKDPATGAIFEQWFQKLEGGATFAEVADWLNAEGVKPGPSCRNKTWTGPMVARVTRNPVLKGVRERSKTVTRRYNQTGQRKREKAPPDELQQRYCEHLAFFGAVRYDRLIDDLDNRNAGCRRREIDGRDPRAQIPKKRTRFPGQAAYCGVCGRNYVYGAHGRNHYLMCRGAREHLCWNGVTIPEVETRDRVCEAVFKMLAALPEFDESFLATLREQERRLETEQSRGLRAAEADVSRLGGQLNNVLTFILDGQNSPALKAELVRLERERSEAHQLYEDFLAQGAEPLTLPSSREIHELALASFKDLARDSFEFARQLRVLIPRIVVLPYRLCDGGRAVLRAKFRLEFSKLILNRKARESVVSQLDREIELDLFEPPQREQHRQAIVALKKQGMTYDQAGRQCGITGTAAQRSAALQRTMDELGLVEPYVLLTEPPDDGNKLRRHRHPRYKFTPLDSADL